MRRLRICISFIVLFVCLQVGYDQSAAAYRSEYKGFYYTIRNGEVTIHSSNAKVDGGDVIIPSEIEGLPVTTIADYAFGHTLNFIGSVVIPDSVTSIGKAAFRYSGVEEVTIGKGVKQIGEEAFRNNRLTSINIPDGVEVIKKFAFASNKITGHLIIPSSMKELGLSVFSNNELQQVTVDTGVQQIGSSVFSNNRLTNVVLPNTITSIGSGAFTGNQLKEVTIPNSVQMIEGSAFSNNQLKKVSLSTNVQTIGKGAFSNNQLQQVTIPNSIQIIEEHAFSNNQLKKVSLSTNVQTIGEHAFRSNQLQQVTIPNSVQRIEGYAFSDNKLTHLIIPHSVKYIGSQAFSENPLKEVTLGKGLESTGSDIFSGSNLQVLRIPSGMNMDGNLGLGMHQSKVSIFWGSDQDLPLTINPVSDQTTSITGTTKPGAMVFLILNNKESATTTANSKGRYAFNVLKQELDIEAGVEVRVMAYDEKDKKANTKVTTVADKTAPSKPTVGKVSASTTKLTGKAEANALVFVYKGKTKLGSVKADAKGSFTLTINKQKKGTELTIYAQDQAGNKSKSVVITVGK